MATLGSGVTVVNLHTILTQAFLPILAPHRTLWGLGVGGAGVPYFKRKADLAFHLVTIYEDANMCQVAWNRPRSKPAQMELIIYRRQTSACTGS